MDTTQYRYRGRYIHLLEQDGWEYASRAHRRGVAVLIPVTQKEEIVLVEQYRIPVAADVIELPAGLIGDQAEYADEPVLEAARRELLEETGFAAASLTRWISCPTTAGLSDEKAIFIKAEGLKRLHPGGGDDSEDIQVHIIALSEVDQWLYRQAEHGKLIDPKIFTALYWLRQPPPG